jgi:hypothetical protein
MEEDRTGDWTKFGCTVNMGFFKSEQILVSDELKSVLKPEQEYLNLPTVPHYEAYTHFPLHWFVPDYPLEHLNYLCLVAFVYNSQSRRETTLAVFRSKYTSEIRPEISLASL